MAQCQITLVFYVATLFIFAYVLFYRCLPPTDEFELDDEIIIKYQQQALIRRQILNEKIESDGYGILYNVLVPEVFCKNLIRIGTVGDGGKWVCNPTNLMNFESCTIYSFGMNNDPSFEEDFQNFLNNKCQLRCIDKDDQTSATMDRLRVVNGAFKKALIGARRDDSLNMFQITDIASEFGDRKIDILKIDIEGAEFDILENLYSMPICQLMIEVHGQTPKDTLKLLRTLSEHGYYLFSYEINGYHHHLSEYSFIHRNCFEEYTVCPEKIEPPKNMQILRMGVKIKTYGFQIRIQHVKKPIHPQNYLKCLSGNIFTVINVKIPCPKMIEPLSKKFAYGTIKRNWLSGVVKHAFFSSSVKKKPNNLHWHQFDAMLKMAFLPFLAFFECLQNGQEASLTKTANAIS